MDAARTGIILWTEKYSECASFYRDLFQLKVLYQASEGVFQLTRLRFSVPDFDTAAAWLESFGLPVTVNRMPWGSTFNIADPDGNPIDIRDEATFVSQIQASE